MWSEHRHLRSIFFSIGLMFWSMVACLNLFPSNSAYAQDGGYMIVRGKVEEGEAPLNGVKVELIKNGKKVDETITKSGKFTFDELPITPEGDIYIIRISKPGHVTLKQQISTKAPTKRRTKYPEYRPTIELFKMVKEVEKEKALMEILDKPISKFGYNTRRGDFEDDRAYFSTIKAKVDQLFDILEAEKQDQYKLLAEYRLKKIEEQKKIVEEAKKDNINMSFKEKYDNSIATADKAYDSNKLEKAKELYRQVMVSIAKSKLPKSDRDELKKYPKSRIFEIETLIAEIAERGEVVEDPLADGEKVTSDPEVESQDIKPEEEDEAARLLREEEEAKEREIAQNQAIRAEKEKEIIEALAERDRMLKEQKEEIIQKRKETESKVMAKKLLAEAKVKASIRENERIAQQKEVKKAENMEVKAKDTQGILKTMAASTIEQKKKVAKASGSGSMAATAPGKLETLEERHVKSFTTHYIKNIKDLSSNVRLIHNRYKVSEMTQKEEKKKTPAKEIVFKPRVIQTVEEDMFKTINYTIVKYPIKPDTLQQVSYLWGATYYYQNSKEIDEATYKKVLENL